MVPHQHRAPEKRKSVSASPTRLYVFLIPTGDTLKKAYLEECLYAGGDSSDELDAIDVPMILSQEAEQLKTRTV